MASVKTRGGGQQLILQRNQLRNNSKAKVNAGRGGQPERDRKGAQAQTIIYYTENDDIQGNENSRNASLRKGADQACESDLKVFSCSSFFAESIKSSLKNMDKTKAKDGFFRNLKIGRKALADVTNVANRVAGTSKPTKSKIEKSALLPRVSLGVGARSVNISSRKSMEEKGKESRGVDEKLASQRGIKGQKALLNSQRIKTTNISQESAADGRMGSRSSLVSTRKSLPAYKRLYPANASNSKGKVESSREAKKANGFPVKDKVGKKVSLASNSGNFLRRNRASDGLLKKPPRTNADVHTSLAQSIKPIVNTAVRVSNAQRTSLKPKGSTSSNKPKLVDSVSSKKVASEVSNEKTLDVGSGNPSTNASAISGNRRRRSYTSLLMAGSKFLEEHREVKQELPNIDDSCNQLDVAEYVDDIYQYYWVIEAQQPSLENYMSIQQEITPQMRGILINWLIEVHSRFDLMPETLYLMVTVLDRYLSQVNIEKKEMQLVGITSLLLASKYEDFWHPRVKDLISISAEFYTRNQVLQMEKFILRKLKFRLNVPTPYVFMLRFLKAAQSDTKKLEHLSFYLIELSLVEHEALRFRPSLLCASAVYIARCTLQMKPAWTPLLGKHAHYGLPQIRDCAEMILRLQKSAKTSQLDVTYKKYTSPDLSSVARMKPLERLSF
ncbi:hypothetical protein ACFE04_023174 [Oxalis oulophora]